MSFYSNSFKMFCFQFSLRIEKLFQFPPNSRKKRQSFSVISSSSILYFISLFTFSNTISSDFCLKGQKLSKFSLLFHQTKKLNIFCYFTNCYNTKKNFFLIFLLLFCEKKMLTLQNCNESFYIEKFVFILPSDDCISFFLSSQNTEL
jgi:hypothetical protein